MKLLEYRMDSLLSNTNLGYKNLYRGIAHRSSRNRGGRGVEER